MAKFNTRALAGAVIGATAVAAALALVERNSSTSEMGAASAGKERCYGIAKAGENGCAAADESHTCGGLAKADYDGQDWKMVETGTCVNMGGKLEAFDKAPPPAAEETHGG